MNNLVIRFFITDYYSTTILYPQIRVSSLEDSSVWLKKIECRIHCCDQSVQSTEIYPAQMEKVDNLKKELCQKGFEVKMSRHL